MAESLAKHRWTIAGKVLIGILGGGSLLSIGGYVGNRNAATKEEIEKIVERVVAAHNQPLMDRIAALETYRALDKMRLDSVDAEMRPNIKQIGDKVSQIAETVARIDERTKRGGG